MAQCAERSLPTPKICGSNPNIGKDKFVNGTSVNCNPEKTKIKKEAGKGPLKKEQKVIIKKNWEWDQKKEIPNGCVTTTTIAQINLALMQFC